MPYIINGMRDLLERGDNLPTLPTVVFQLHRVLDDENAGANEVAAIIEKDPALTARLLRAANSAAFSRGGDRLGSVSSSVARMGVNQVRAVCIVLAVVKAFAHREGGLDHEAFWAHSATVAALAQKLWNRFSDKPTVSGDDAYVAGLLHDTGLLVLEQHFFNDFSPVLKARAEHGGRLWQLEEQHLGLDHGEVGGLLLGRWSLPAFIGEAVTNHHHPHMADEGYLRLCRVIQAAEVLATAGGAGLPEEGEVDCSPADVLLELGATEEEVDTMVASVAATAERARQFLS
jgi:HD-like signal output (HDOD) protein